MSDKENMKDGGGGGAVMPIIKCAMWMAISSASILMDLICFFHSFVVLCCTGPKCLQDLNVSKCLQDIVADINIVERMSCFAMSKFFKHLGS